MSILCNMVHPLCTPIWSRCIHTSVLRTVFTSQRVRLLGSSIILPAGVPEEEAVRLFSLTYALVAPAGLTPLPPPTTSSSIAVAPPPPPSLETRIPPASTTASVARLAATEGDPLQSPVSAAEALSGAAREADMEPPFSGGWEPLGPPCFSVDVLPSAVGRSSEELQADLLW